MNSDENGVYMKIVALNEIYNFVVLSFSFKVIKKLKWFINIQLKA